MDIIADAPVRFLVPSMGDALTTWFEADSCFKTQSMNECGGTSTLSGLNLARLCLDILLEHGLQAKLDAGQKKVTPALEAVTEANILLSGIGFESGGLAAAHAIHNGLTALDETHNYYHGEKVDFGVLAGLHLNAATTVQMNEIYSFCEKIDLPTTLADIGITDATPEKLMKVALKTPEEGSSICHEASAVTPERILEAMIAADYMGKARRQV